MGIWNNIVNGYKDTEEYSFFKRVKDTWKKANSEQRKEMIRKTARNAALTVGSFVAGGMIGGVGGVVAVAVGWGAYGVHQEYKARKQAGLSKAVSDNGGRPLTPEQKKMANHRALFRALESFGLASVAVPPVQDVETAKDGAWAKVNKNKNKETPIAAPKVEVKTEAFDFKGMMSNQGGRKF